MVNPFEMLDAQSSESRFAQFTTEEHQEFQAWLDAQPQPMNAPDAHLEASYEERTHIET